MVGGPRRQVRHVCRHSCQEYPRRWTLTVEPKLPACTKGKRRIITCLPFLDCRLWQRTCETNKTRTGRESRLLNWALLGVRSRSRRRIKFFAIIRLLTTCRLRRSFTLYGVGLAHHSRTFWVGSGAGRAASHICLLPLRTGTGLWGCDICPRLWRTRFVSKRPQELHLFFSLRNADLWLVPFPGGSGGTCFPRVSCPTAVLPRGRLPFAVGIPFGPGGRCELFLLLGRGFLGAAIIVWIASWLGQRGSGRSRLRCSGCHLTEGSQQLNHGEIHS